MNRHGRILVTGARAGAAPGVLGTGDAKEGPQMDDVTRQAAKRSATYRLLVAQELLDCAREGRVPRLDVDGKVVPRDCAAASGPLHPMPPEEWERIMGELVELARRRPR